MTQTISDKYLDAIYKLKNLVRYNTRSRIKDESVAEHSFYVAVLTLDICKKFDIDYDTTCKCVIKATLHDMPEMYLNDITHDVKEKLNLRPLLKTYEDEYYKKYYPQYADLMNNANELITTIVDLADAYSVKQYVNNEKSLGNNTVGMNDILDEINGRIHMLTEKLNKCKIHMYI